MGQGGGPFRSVQGLRGLAALMVVAFHAIEMWDQRLAVAPGWRWTNGSAGVDIFFVISGFVMVIAARPLARGVQAARLFLLRRLARIVPLYWVMTTVKLLTITVGPALALHTRPDLWNVIGSYLFIPTHDAAGAIRPVLPVGWTLSFEMLFYGLFALGLARRGRVLRTIVPVLGGLALLGLFRSQSWPAISLFAHGMVLEFVLGVALARFVLGGGRLPASVAAALLGIGLIALATLPSGSANLRLLAWGVPAAGIVAGAVALEAPLGRVLPCWSDGLGAASYAIYLGHGFVLPLVGSLMLWLGTRSELLAVALGLLASVATGVALHVAVEQPLQRLFRRSRPAAIAAPAVGDVVATAPAG